MLNFFPAGMVERYLLFTLLAVLGVLQLMAARHGWVGFSFVGRDRRAWGYVTGAVLLGGAYLWFFGRQQHLIFQPGLAGTELLTVFAMACMMAVGITLALASVLNQPVVTESELPGEEVDLDPGAGILIRPVQPDARAAVVVVSDLPGGDFPLAPLAERLAEQDIDVLYVDLAHNGPVAYPEILARVPAACAYLQDRADRPERRVMLVGAGVGGDLVLRAAGTDSNVCGVAAVNPVLEPARTGIELLYTTTLWEAVRWGGVRRRLVEALRASERFAQLEHRPALLVYASNPTPVHDLPATADVRVKSVASVDEAVEAVDTWVNHTKVGENYVA